MLNSIYHQTFYEYFIFKDIQFYFQNTLIEPIQAVIIDDSKKDSDLLMEILSTECTLNFNFRMFSNPHLAIEHLEQYSTPDIILLDMKMPSINGRTVLEKLKRYFKTKDVPIVMHSSLSDKDSIESSNILGAHAYFKKPINGEAFEKFLINTLDY